MKKENHDSLLYEGKAKKIYKWQEESLASSLVRVEFKDSLTAFNAQKKGSFPDKGSVNRDIASLIFSYLKKFGISSHWLRDDGAISMIVKEVKIIPLEVVVRNVLAGSTAKKLGIEEGRPLKKALVEFYYKNDALEDPFVSDDQILMLEIIKESEIAELKKQALKINEVIKKMFATVGLQLIDFKIEFGWDDKGEILLADEITPDCCRLWDVLTQEKMDKDRFRRDLGQVRDSYVEVLNRLKKGVSSEN